MNQNLENGVPGKMANAALLVGKEYKNKKDNVALAAGNAQLVLVDIRIKKSEKCHVRIPHALNANVPGQTGPPAP